MSPTTWAGTTLFVCTALGARALAQSSALDDPSVVPEPPAEIQLPLPPDLRLDVDRLDGWLRIQDERAEGARIESGVWGVGLGALQVGLGAWLMLDDETFGIMPVRGLIGGLSLGLGLSVLAMGIHGLATTSFAHQRRLRWRAALARGIDDRELGRFEGELRAEAELARFLRFVEAAAGFANLGAGLATIAVTALAPLDLLGQIGGYAMGGALALIGIISALGALLGESRAETEWRLYRSGRDPDEAEPDLQISVTPSVGPDGAGIGIQGTF